MEPTTPARATQDEGTQSNIIQPKISQPKATDSVVFLTPHGSENIHVRGHIIGESGTLTWAATRDRSVLTWADKLLMVTSPIPGAALSWPALAQIAHVDTDHIVVRLERQGEQDRVQRREYFRAVSDVSAELWMPGATVALVCRAVDLSVGGARICNATAVPLGSQINIVLHLQSGPLQVEAVVVGSVPVEENTVRLCFVNMSKASSQILSKEVVTMERRALAAIRRQ